MTEIKKATIVDAIYSADLGNDALYESYSGRGMYGDKCFGIVGHTRDLLQFFVSLIEDKVYDEDVDVRIDLARDLADHARSDNMGTGTIFYFPGFTLSE